MKKLALLLILVLTCLGSYVIYMVYFNESKELVINERFEYIENGETYRIHGYASSIIGTIKLNIEGKTIRVNSFEKEKRIPYEEASQYFDNYFDYQDLYIIEDGTYYTYFNENRLEMQEEGGFYIKGLEELNINPKEDMLFKDGDSYFFVKEEIKKIELVSVNVIKDIKNKKLFLKYLRDDFIKHPDTENKDLMVSALIKKAYDLTDGKEDKVKALYDWTVDNLSYDFTDIEDRRIFSGLETYKRKIGVCDGYTKLFLYFLLALGYEDLEQVPGTVLNTEDFGIIGHAWVRIGDKYYDPTFENTGPNDKNNSFYYALPKKLFYADRIETLDIPQNLINTSTFEREALVLSNYKEQLKFYDYNQYPVLRYYQLRSEITNGENRNITINDLVSYYGGSEYKNGIVNYKGKNHRVKKYTYLELKNDNTYLESIIKYLGTSGALVVKQGEDYNIIFNLVLEPIG